jgi:hypothetical protein
MNYLSRSKKMRLCLVIGGLIIATGCASVPEPVAELASARTALRAIENTDARDQAPVELDRAKTKLQRAETATSSKNYAEARRLAEESLADAELAAAKTSAAKAQRNANELERSIALMRDEIERARTQR